MRFEKGKKYFLQFSTLQLTVWSPLDRGNTMQINLQLFRLKAWPRVAGYSVPLPLWSIFDFLHCTNEIQCKLEEQHLNTLQLSELNIKLNYIKWSCISHFQLFVPSSRSDERSSTWDVSHQHETLIPYTDVLDLLSVSNVYNFYFRLLQYATFCSCMLIYLVMKQYYKLFLPVYTVVAKEHQDNIHKKLHTWGQSCWDISYSRWEVLILGNGTWLISGRVSINIAQVSYATVWYRAKLLLYCNSKHSLLQYCIICFLLCQCSLIAWGC